LPVAKPQAGTTECGGKLIRQAIRASRINQIFPGIYCLVEQYF